MERKVSYLGTAVTEVFVAFKSPIVVKNDCLTCLGHAQDDEFSAHDCFQMTSTSKSRTSIAGPPASFDPPAFLISNVAFFQGKKDQQGQPVQHCRTQQQPCLAFHWSKNIRHFANYSSLMNPSIISLAIFSFVQEWRR
jgi:hypothetical protein